MNVAGRRDVVHAGGRVSAENILAKVKQLSENRALMVSLSGGNPAIQPLKPLIDLGHAEGYRFALETQGSVAQDWFEDLDVLTLSPKPPSSAMETDWNKFDECIKAAKSGPEIALKIVVFDEQDYAYAQTVAEKYPDLPLYLQPGNHKTEGDPDYEGLNARMHWLVEKVQTDHWFKASVLPQLHVLLWGNQRGV